ncbi:MAG: hypothetical protein GWO38_13215, partial [Phycisphaerae bacterium]|nr:hypothetical protein [Phycisphaerae bacterium]NIX28556.1 hypothetical protein [Phycisphaerae bacterium]
PQTVGKSHTSLTEDIFEHPYVKRLEGEVVEYKNLYREQVTRTEEIQRESADKILALTQQVLIAGSKNLGDYLLESFGMKRQNMAPDAQERVEPSSS